MEFYIPTKVLFEDNVVQTHKSEFKKYGRKALLVTGRESAHKSGVLNDLLPLLENENLGYHIFDEVTENPDLSVIRRGKECLLEQGCDFVIGIGGGSPLDAGKAISVMGANNLSEKELYEVTLHKNHFPILAIPTTSGTGSEITQYSVITNRETSIKAGFGSEKCFPKVSFLDPKYTLSLNARVTRDTAIDALSHLLEGLYSNKYNEFLLPFIHTGVKLIYDNLSLCLKDLSCIKYRHNLMLAANYGGIVIAHTSTTLQHSIGYPLTTVFGVSHGLANGLVMRQIMNLYEPHIKDRTDRLFVKLNITKDAFFKWLDSFEMVFEGKIDEVFLKNRVPEVLKSRNMTLSPCVVNEQEITNIYKTL